MRITSRANPTVKELRRLAERREREETGLFYVEGFRVVQEAFVVRAEDVTTLVVAPELLTREERRWLEQAARRPGLRTLEVTPEVMGVLFTRHDPQGAAVVLRQRWERLDEVRPGDETCWVALSQVQHPGSLGTILRISDAVGGGGAILIGPSTDPHDPTAVRASLGAVLSQRLVRASLEQFAAWKQEHGYAVVGTSPAATMDYHEFRYPHPVVVLMGSERLGLSDEERELCDEVVRIPMMGRVESHHLVVATSVVLYEILNQRRGQGPGARGQ
jgi:TrmH family RNA methyltransferase